MNLAAFLVGMVGPLAARLLVASGLSLVSVAGLAAAVTALKSTLTSSISQLPAAVLQLGGLFGIWECFGIVLGAVAFVVSWQSTRGFWMLAKK